MDELIYKQAAYDALMAEPLKWDDSSVWESARCHQWMMDMDAIKALSPAQPDRSLWFRIGEICVDESKGIISADSAVEKIRELLREAGRRTDG